MSVQKPLTVPVASSRSVTENFETLAFSFLTFMGESQVLRATTSASLPPGCQFYPSDEQLLCYYLTNKNTSANENDNQSENFYGCNLIRELDLYDHDPFELPDVARFSYGYGGRRRHWYCYTMKIVKGKSRKVKSGFWRRKGKVKDVLSSNGKDLVGTRSSFVFYLGNSLKDAIRTDRILYEYSLLGHLKASFVLCRVFVKPHRKNSASENGLSSCAEETVSAVRHIGIQHDEYVTPNFEAKMCDQDSVDRKKEISVYPARCASELDAVMTAPVSVATLQCSPSLQSSQQGRCSGLPAAGATFVEAVTSQHHLLSILEEDFIELDDLI